jgi:hypothetical protein
MKDLFRKALVTNLKIRQWSANKYDRKVSEEIEKHHNATNAGRYNKTLIADKELKEIQKIANSARTFVYEQTLPWGDNGDRLLPSTNYLEFVSAFGTYISQFEHAVKNFIREYPALKDEARRRLNGMFKETDYPSIPLMEKKFSIEVSHLPVSKVDDFYLELGEEDVEALRQQIENEFQSRIYQTTKHIWTKIKETVGHMVEKLSDEEAVFKNSLVENIRELVDVLPRLNFTNDPDISLAIHQMNDLLVDPDLLRNNVSVRFEKATEAKAILDKVNDFLGIE